MLKIFPYFITIFIILMFVFFLLYNAKRFKDQNEPLSKLLKILGYVAIGVLIIVVLPGLSLLVQYLFF